jgi:citrate lyase subunit beta / citryl-CoA lyase
VPNNSIKVRRSALYMPCSNQRALDKATGLETDVILFDLEDAVSPSEKLLAREYIVAALASKDYGRREKIVRINGLDSAWGQDDIKALVDSDIDGLLIPKAESLEQINQVLALLGRIVPIWLMIETPKGVLQVEQLAQHEHVTVLVMGTNDLAKELRVEQSESREEFSYAFGRCVVAARAYQCDILDGVYNQLDDLTGLEQVCQQGKRIGFDGKTLIHPKQLAITNDVFMPSAQQIQQAQQIVDAWQGNQDKGVIVVNGKLVEGLHVEQAQRLLQIYAAISESKSRI